MKFGKPLCECRDCRVWARYERAWSNWKRLEALFDRAGEERREASRLLQEHLDEIAGAA